MKIKVIPNAKKFGICIIDGLVVARLKSLPANNAANLELLSELKRITRAKVHLLKGAKSREKEIFFVGLSDPKAMEMIAGVAEPGQKK